MHEWFLDDQRVIRFSEIVKHIVGEKWVRIKINQWGNREKPKKYWKSLPGKDIPQHQLIYWFTEYEKWKESGEEKGVYETDPIIAKLAILGRSLEATQSQKNFTSLIQRLKSPDEFLKAAFEIEVAEKYIKSGYDVEFVEVNENKTPDLMVTDKEGQVFWVECKRRDELTERDRLIRAIWDELEQKILDKIQPEKLNYCIGIRAIRDPKRSDVQLLSQKIFSLLEAIEYSQSQIIKKEPHRFSCFGDQFEILIARLADPDQPIGTIRTAYLNMNHYDRGTIMSFVKIMENGQPLTINPSVVHMGTDIPSDKITGIIDSFRAARKQIPSDGPGVIWIRAPDNFKDEDFDLFDSRIKRLIQKELNINQNRRINLVVVETRIFKEVKEKGGKGIIYATRVARVEHPNPKKQITI